MKEQSIKAALDHWVEAVRTSDVQTVLNCYASESQLLPTLDATIANNSEKKQRYFKSFLAKGPICTITDYYATVLSESAGVINGNYSFRFADGSSAAARFTYVFVEEAGELKIQTHHSSLQPAR